jgi:hypothetical protein
MAYSKHAPVDLLHHANENWTTLTPSQHFGTTHTCLPNHWAQQFLGLNFSATKHQGGGTPLQIKKTLFGLYLIQYQLYLSIFESL